MVEYIQVKFIITYGKYYHSHKMEKTIKKTHVFHTVRPFFRARLAHWPDSGHCWVPYCIIVAYAYCNSTLHSNGFLFSFYYPIKTII